MKFYSVILRKSIDIPDKQIKTVTKGGRKFAVGTYMVDGKPKQAWRVLGRA
jgi:hypothetical protein